MIEFSSCQQSGGAGDARQVRYYPEAKRNRIDFVRETLNKVD